MRAPFLLACVFSLATLASVQADPLTLLLRSRTEASASEKVAAWEAQKTALIIFDVWGDLWCKSAAHRVGEHIEKYWCPSFTSTDLTGRPPFRFQEDIGK